MTGFADIADFEEDKRIEIIGHNAMDHKRTVGFIVDAMPYKTPQEKADRYIEKLQARYPGIRIIERGAPGPLAGTLFVKVGPPLN